MNAVYLQRSAFIFFSTFVLISDLRSNINGKKILQIFVEMKLIHIIALQCQIYK